MLPILKNGLGKRFYRACMINLLWSLITLVNIHGKPRRVKGQQLAGESQQFRNGLEKGIHFEKRTLSRYCSKKCELVPTVKKYKPEEETVEYCSESDKTIELLQLLVGHSELNPVELIWDQIKFEVVQKMSLLRYLM